MRRILYLLKNYPFFHLLRLGFKEIYRIIILNYFKNSYSQFGEDLVISDFFKDKQKTGFFVDIGAHDPVRLNNTYRLYKKGWRGINVDADPFFVDKLAKTRPLDQNLNMGIGDSNSKMTLYLFSAPALNTFSKESMKESIEVGHKVVGQKTIEIMNLNDFFDKHCANKSIDLLSIDIEGLDFLALKSIDWKRYKPTIVCVENKDFSGKMTQDGEKINQLLVSVGYKELSQTSGNGIYMKQ